MPANPAEETLRLTALYAQMSELELVDLARSYDGLTETARQVLRDQMLKRQLGDPAAPPAPVRLAPRPPAAEEVADGSEQDCEFTWKTLLCECEQFEQAWQMRELLRRSGVETWLDGPRSAYPRILVAADQLDQARQLLSQPIPQEIVELSRQQIPEFEAPVCPACGASDPILDENPDPNSEANLWFCESCGHQWDDCAGPADPLEIDPPPTGEKIL
jgi:hypothetical protein